MSDVMRDLWPVDVTTEEVLSPEEILQPQAEFLTERTNGLLVGHIVKTNTEDRVVLGFEAEAPRINSRARLFEIQHRLDFEYPAIFISPDKDLPTYLRDRVFVPNYQSGAAAFFSKGDWKENDLLAKSPMEFADKLAEVLSGPGVKAIIFSLLARSNRNGPEAENASEES